MEEDRKRVRFRLHKYNMNCILWEASERHNGPMIRSALWGRGEETVLPSHLQVSGFKTRERNRLWEEEIVGVCRGGDNVRHMWGCLRVHTYVENLAVGSLQYVTKGTACRHGLCRLWVRCAQKTGGLMRTSLLKPESLMSNNLAYFMFWGLFSWAA